MSEMRTYKDGSRGWFDGENRLHRTDGPAYLGVDGTKRWYVEGVLHRSDGPAEEWPDGSRCWHQNGARHRMDGPAFEKPSGYQEWWVNGEQMTGDQFRQWQREKEERVVREQREWEEKVDKTVREGLDHPVKMMKRPVVVRKSKALAEESGPLTPAETGDLGASGKPSRSPWRWLRRRPFR